MMVVSLLMMSDSIIAGVVIGSDAVMGVTLITPLYSLAAFFGSVFSLGLPILYSREMGGFNRDRADQIFGTGLLLAIVVGLVLFCLTRLFGNMYLLGCSASEAVLTQARGYLFWMQFTILILPIQMLVGAMVYSDGDEGISSVADRVFLHSQPFPWTQRHRSCFLCVHRGFLRDPDDPLHKEEQLPPLESVFFL